MSALVSSLLWGICCDSWQYELTFKWAALPNTATQSTHQQDVCRKWQQWTRGAKNQNLTDKKNPNFHFERYCKTNSKHESEWSHVRFLSHWITSAWGLSMKDWTLSGIRANDEKGLQLLSIIVICGLSLSLVLVLAPRGFSPGSPVFPSPQKPTFPNANSI